METNNALKKIIPFVVVVFLATLPLWASAVTDSGISNPLGKVSTITEVLTGIIKWMLGLVGILALIALIVAGGRMIIDFGNEDQVRKAKMTITWAVIGLLVVILSYAIVNIVSTQILGAGGSSSGSGGSSLNPPPGT